MGKHKRDAWTEREQIASTMFDAADVIDYQTIKDVAKASHIPATYLIAQTANNDPFYAGSPAPRELAEWFAECYRTYRWGQTHIRRCHYQLVSRRVTLPNGSIYENTEKCSLMLYNIAKTARYLKLVPLDALEDHRNDEASNWRPDPLEQEITIQDDLERFGNAFEFPDMPELPTYTLEGKYDTHTYWALQPYHLEIWCEKSTMNDILLPLCQYYRLTLQTFQGEASLYAVHQLVKRIQKYDKPTRVLYISDFDPSGNNMPAAMANKLMWCIRDLHLEADIRLFPLVLTQEQVEKYGLPRIPIKETANGKQRFEDKYGEDAVELDALEALHPGELGKIVRTAIRSYHDDTLWDRVDEQQGKLESKLEEIQDEVYDNHQEELDALQAEHESKKAEFDAWANDYNHQISAVYKDIRQKLEEKTPDLDDYPLPEGEEADELGDELYNSTRGFYEQVKVFRQHQGKYHGDEQVQADTEREKERLEQEQAEKNRIARIEAITTLLQGDLVAEEYGALLCEAKTLLRRGFMEWVKTRLPFSQSTAQRYMRRLNGQSEEETDEQIRESLVLPFPEFDE